MLMAALMQSKDPSVAAQWSRARYNDKTTELIDTMRGELVDMNQERTALAKHLDTIQTILGQQLGTAPDTTLLTSDQIQDRLISLNQNAARCRGQ